LAIFQNAFNEYAHGSFWRILAPDDREPQTFFARTLLQYERVERAKRRPRTSRQRAESRAIRIGELLTTATTISAQVHRRNVVFSIGLPLRRRYIHHSLSDFVVLLDGRCARHGDTTTVVVVHGRLGHPPLQQFTITVIRFGHVEKLRIPFCHQQVYGGAAIV